MCEEDRKVYDKDNVRAEVCGLTGMVHILNKDILVISMMRSELLDIANAVALDAVTEDEV